MWTIFDYKVYSKLQGTLKMHLEIPWRNFYIFRGVVKCEKEIRNLKKDFLNFQRNLRNLRKRLNKTVKQ